MVYAERDMRTSDDLLDTVNGEAESKEELRRFR